MTGDYRNLTIRAEESTHDRLARIVEKTGQSKNKTAEKALIIGLREMEKSDKAGK